MDFSRLNNLNEITIRSMYHKKGMRAQKFSSSQSLVTTEYIILKQLELQRWFHAP